LDWKRFYGDELGSEDGRAAIAAALERRASGSVAIVRSFQRWGAVSFPHTLLRSSADPIARVVQSIYEVEATRVVALGVLHGGTLPSPWREDAVALREGGAGALEAYARLSGAFFDPGPAHTVFGDVPPGPQPLVGSAMREGTGILANEFSLDLFLAILAAAAQRRGVAAPAVTRVFVSATRDPAGGFAMASQVAESVRMMLGPGVPVVATGDLVHFGTTYTPPETTGAMASDPAALAAHFRPLVDRMFEEALARGDHEAAFRCGTDLRSDQRHLLPVLSELLGRDATARVVSFEMADYAPVHGVAPPSVVASALVAMRPRRTGKRDETRRDRAFGKRRIGGRRRHSND
jgi:hypothetical protein